jgi:hypothetical protein
LDKALKKSVSDSLEDKVVSLDDSGALWHISKPMQINRFGDKVNWLLTKPPKREVDE